MGSAGHYIKATKWGLAKKPNIKTCGLININSLWKLALVALTHLLLEDTQFSYFTFIERTAVKILKDPINIKCTKAWNETFNWIDTCIYDREYISCEQTGTTRHLYYCAEFECPSHFKCDNSYCVPIRHRCDNQWDCPNGEDENNCLDFDCYGLFFCPFEQKCLSFLDVCDGTPHCTDTEIDEQYCDVRPCPNDCFCVGRSIQCVD